MARENFSILNLQRNTEKFYIRINAVKTDNQVD